jgi:myo-inositol-1(or 4)-monophosphatase
MPVYLAQLQNVLTSSAGVRRAGSAALDLANVACGRFDAFWELMLAPWDVAAGILLVREAGGMVTNLEGAQATPVHAPLVASNGHLHHWLLHLLAQPRPADKSRPEKGVT